MGLGVLCFTTGSPDTLAPLVERYKTEIVNAEPVGEYVNNNVMVTSQMLCLEDGQKVRDIASDMTSGYQNSLVFHYLDTFPTPPGIPEWPALIPEPTPAEIGERIEAGLVCMGTPDEVREVGAGVRRHRRRPARVRHAVDDDAGGDRDRGGRDVRQARDPAVRQRPRAPHDAAARGVRRGARAAAVDVALPRARRPAREHGRVRRARSRWSRARAAGSAPRPRCDSPPRARPWR